MITKHVTFYNYYTQLLLNTASYKNEIEFSIKCFSQFLIFTNPKKMFLHYLIEFDKKDRSAQIRP